MRNGYQVRTNWNDREGFTLLEILVTIVISAVLAVILVQVMNNQTQRSYRPVQDYDSRLALDSAMENVTADYRALELPESPPGASPLVTLQERIEPLSGHTSYWPEAAGISVTNNYCLDLNEDASANPGENNIQQTCSLSARILKVTLSKGDLSLTALFTLE